MDLFPKLMMKFEELIFPENGKCERNGDTKKKRIILLNKYTFNLILNW